MQVCLGCVIVYIDDDIATTNECGRSAEPSPHVWFGKQLENDLVTDKEITADNIWLYYNYYDVHVTTYTASPTSYMYNMYYMYYMYYMYMYIVQDYKSSVNIQTWKQLQSCEWHKWVGVEIASHGRKLRASSKL